MLKESFLGHYPSHFHINPFVKTYIISESFLWSAWNFIAPIFAIFVVESIPGGSIEIAATAYSVHLVARVIAELATGRFLIGSKDRTKLYTTLFGMLLLTAAYLGFAFSREIVLIFVFYCIAGMGHGIAAPAKNTLFAIHLDKNKESSEWGIADATTFICMALSTALGGFIAGTWGFQILFILAGAVSTVAALPYIFYLKIFPFTQKGL